jgi:hypothetical protein
MQKTKSFHPQFTFPPSDLLPLLIGAYMANLNVYYPLLHAPTFNAAVASNLHYSDPDFATTLLLVCAIGSRHVDDPRVLLPSRPKRSSGWMWYNQCHVTKPDILAPQTLYKIQSYILGSIYAAGSFYARVPWMMINMALRSMQELGVDRQRVYSTNPQPVEELWKRCFW